ncbi:hypothetical protein OG900_33090 [Streptomyces sp. NBC_00433]
MTATDHPCFYGCLICLERKTRGASPSLSIARAVQTCAACPSQWDAWTEDGDYLYLRYRWGVGTARYGDILVAQFDTDDPWGGVMGLDEFCARAGIILADDAEALGRPTA